jgi:hypothetical protein
MKLTRYRPIADVVLDKADVENLFALLQREAAASDVGAAATMTVLSADGMITETDDPMIFDDDIVDHRKSRRIELRYSDRHARRIFVVLEEEERGSWHKSAFTVSGDDPAWVDARFAELERSFVAVRPQSKALARLRWVIIIPSAIAIAYSWTMVLSRNVELLLPRAAGGAPPSTVARFFGEHRLMLYEIFLILFCLPWVVLARSLVGWVEKLWPAVEFDFGPDRRNRRRKVRFRLAVITALLVLPIVIALVNGRVFGLS